MSLASERYQRVREVFHAACERDPADRSAFLDEACGEDDELRAEVESLLAHDEKRGDQPREFESGIGLGLLAKAAAINGGGVLPERIGRYRVKRVLASGGMGTVYEAEQEHPRRAVAVKVMRLGVVSRSALRRFEYESQILACLRHPAIAQVYEAGTHGGAGGVPYFAMEYIQGARTIKEYAEDKRLSTRRRLELFAQVCDAIQHGHQRGIVHRDLKPGNILVDEAGQPKIIDFGIARVTETDLTIATLQTGVGQLVGTLQYMSPEQCAGVSTEVDTRCDVYALGVVLYELLTGELPYDLSSSSPFEAPRVIREQEPRRPSSISRALRGEVETIVLKALEKDKTRRYQSAAELASDIRRYLRGEPIEAKRDSALYVLKKTLGRYRRLAAAATLVVALIAAFGIVSFIQAERNRRLAADERSARERADAASGQLRRELAASNIERGRLLCRTGDLMAAEELIWREHLREPTSNHSFWALWGLYSHNPSLATLGTHERTVHAVAYAPSGSLVASAGDDAVVKLWDTVTLRCVAILRRHAGPVRGLAFGADGRHLASASLDGTVIVWDLATKESIRTLRGHESGVYSVCYSPDGTSLICGVGDGCIHIVDAATGEPIRTFEEHGDAIWCLRFSPDGSLLASGSSDGTIRLWRDLTGPSVATLSGHRRAVDSLAFSPDGRTLISGSTDKTFRVWDLSTYECADTIRPANGYVTFVRFPRGGQSLIVGGSWRVDAWDLINHTRRQLQAHGVAVGDISPDGRFLACGIGHHRLWPRKAIRLAEVAPDAGLLRLGGTSGRGPAAVSPDGRLIAVGDAAGRVRLWETTTGRLLATLEGHPGRWSSCHFHPSGRLLATCTAGEVKLWDLATGALGNTLRGHHAPSTHSLSFSPDGETMAATWHGGTIQIREVPSGDVVATIPATENEALSVRFSPDGKTIAATYRWGPIRLYSRQGELLAEFDAVVTPWTAAFSPDGKKLAVACWAREIQLWDLVTHTLEARLEASKAAVWEVAYMPGRSNILASCSADGYVHVWDLSEQRNLLTLDPFDGFDAVSVSFTADGKTLVAAGGDGSLCVWDLEYFERHMAGHARFYMDLLRDEMGEAIQTDYVTAWADEVLRRPWPRIGPYAQPNVHLPEDDTALGGVDPEVIATWGNSAERQSIDHP
jgi:WD40 repeat protein/predicted Ser/Thr protein kinase